MPASPSVAPPRPASSNYVHPPPLVSLSQPCAERFFHDGNPLFLELSEHKKAILKGHFAQLEGLYSEIEVATTAEHRHAQHLKSFGRRAANPGSGGQVMRPKGRPLPEDQDMFLPCCTICPEQFEMPSFYDDTLVFLQEHLQQAYAAAHHARKAAKLSKRHRAVQLKQLEWWHEHQDHLRYQLLLEEAERHKSGNRRGASDGSGTFVSAVEVDATTGVLSRRRVAAGEGEGEGGGGGGGYRQKDFRGVWWDSENLKWRVRHVYKKTAKLKTLKSEFKGYGLRKDMECCKICPPNYRKLNGDSPKKGGKNPTTEYPWLAGPRNFFAGGTKSRSEVNNPPPPPPQKDKLLLLEVEGRVGGTGNDQTAKSRSSRTSDTKGEPRFVDARSRMEVEVRAEAERQAGWPKQKPQTSKSTPKNWKKAKIGFHAKNFGYPEGCCPVCPPIRQRTYMNKHYEGPYGIGRMIDDGPFGEGIRMGSSTMESKTPKLYYGCQNDQISYCPDAYDTIWSNKFFCKCMRRTLREGAPLIPICYTWVMANC